MMKLNQFICLLIFHVGLIAYGQKDASIYISATDYETRHKLDQISVLIYENEIMIDSLYGKTKDPIKFKLKPGKTYNIFIKKKGKVTRHLEYDLENVTKKYQKEKLVSRIVVSLFDEVKKVDYKFIKENPFAEYYFDTIHKKLVFRFEQADKMSKYVYNKFINSQDQARNNDLLFKSAIKAADSLYLINEYSKALEYYITASRIDYLEAYPSEQIAKINHTLKDIASKKYEDTLEEISKQITSKVTLKDNKFKILETKSELKRNKILPISELPDGLVFSIQVGAYRKIVPEIDFKRLKPVYLDVTNTNLRRYVTGNFKSLDDANNARLNLIQLGYKDAFVIVYFNRTRIKFDEVKLYE